MIGGAANSIEIGKVAEFVGNRLVLQANLCLAIGQGDELEIADTVRHVESVIDRRTFYVREPSQSNLYYGAGVWWHTSVIYQMAWQREFINDVMHDRWVHAVLAADSWDDDTLTACGEKPRGQFGLKPDVYWRQADGDPTMVGAYRVRRCPTCLSKEPLPLPWKDDDWPIYRSNPAV